MVVATSTTTTTTTTATTSLKLLNLLLLVPLLQSILAGALPLWQLPLWAKALPEKAKRWYEQCGSHWHGTRLQSLGNILVCGLRDSNPAIAEGSRTLGDRRSHIGVYFFQERRWVMSRYCLWQDCVGDQVYWSMLIDAAVDWNLCITPTRRNQVVIPQPYVYIRSLRFNICRYEQLSDGCLILPVWVPMLEAAYW